MSNFFPFFPINVLICYLLLTFMTLSPCSGVEQEPPKPTYLSPVILVPGDGGCQIEAKWAKPKTVEFLCTKNEKTWTNLWLTISSLTPYAVNCFVDNMRLVYNSTTRTTSNSPGVETRIPGFGGTATVEYLDPFRFVYYKFVGYFDVLVKKLVRNGYTRKETVKGAPFDFRKAPNELGDFYLNLTTLIEDSFNQEQLKVTLLAHSMGAPVLHYFLVRKTQAWKDKHIQAVISLSGAWGGSVKPVKVFSVGDNLGHYAIPAKKVKFIQRSLPSLAFLMPSRDLWDLDQVLVETPSKNYSLSNIKEYFDAIPFPDGFQMYEDTKDLLHNAPPPGVEVLCLHGLGVPTTEKVVYKTEASFPDSPTFETGDGDGTVNKKSAESCLLWARRQKQKVLHKTFDKVDHMAILSDPKVLQYVASYLQSVRKSNLRSRHPNHIWDTFPEPGSYYS